MDQRAVLARFDEQMRRNARPDDPAARVERIGAVVRQVGARADDWNGVLWSGLDDATADAAIAAQVDYFTSLEREFEWKLYSHDTPADLSARLLAAGFVPDPAETLMVADVKAVKAVGAHAELPDGIRLERVTDAAGVDLAADVHEQAFGTSADRLRLRLASQLRGRPETFSLVVAMAGDVPVCAARMELHPGTDFASLWGGGTVPAWRGRGVYRALVAHRARIAAELGYRYLQVDASDQSRPILERLGFVPLSSTVPHVFRP
ncbi:GNAT family N-acetyltransferase [Streptacidiphilus fuscans]|uniref:GNAT family N-acetyltransferase n=1 Tax=Streptacidiphilus fuscans TaxID=2789292 RepID=A0A931FCD2_9ACTN|nr:GNAT family N-acetyltransferase [Streptacidiphilus fuscans]MBF9067055.1 GNAT family N-acetyltransferase [Streptacidiphilus fuscans]